MNITQLEHFKPLDTKFNDYAVSPLVSSTELTDPLQQLSKLSASSSIQIQAISEPNNSFSTAKNIGSLSGSHTFSDSVGSTDTEDFYRFSLSKTSNLKLSLTGLSADADLQLVQDTNTNGVVDEGEEIKVSAHTGNLAESMRLEPLVAGIYYLRVNQFGEGKTNYNLNLSATTVAKSTPGTAQNLSILKGSRTFSNSVGSTDTEDFYRFSLSNTSNLNLSLTELSADADVQLIWDANKNGMVDYGVTDAGEVIKVSALSDSSPESMLIDPLAAGDYYVRVYQSSGNTNYRLSLQVSFVGNNTLGSARNIGILTGSQTFNESVGSTDTQDFYRFNLSKTTNLNLSITGLSADVGVQLIRDINSNGVVDNGEVVNDSVVSSTTAESIVIDPIAADTYYIRVSQSDENTNYNLSLKATVVGNNTLSSAKNVGLLSSSSTFSDFVGSTDIQDFYRFSLSTISNLNVSLNGLSAVSAVQIIRDTNSNGVVDDGEVLQSSAFSSTVTAAMVLDPLIAGTYYARVYQYSGDTNYNLSLKASVVVNNTLNTAKNVGFLGGSREFSSFVRNTDTQDFYRFSFSANSDFKLSLTGLKANADVQLIRDTNNNGVVDENEEIKLSSLFGNSAESLSYLGLTAGTYYVRVYQASGNTNYKLSLLQSPSNGFNSDYGYGLVDAAAAIARALGQSALPSVANLGGNNWGLDMVKAPEVWAKGYTGQGVVVAVVDTGVDYNHSDLNANIWRNSDEIAGNRKDDDGNGYIDDFRGWDFIDSDNNPMDLDSHGTHVAGTIAAENNRSGVIGVAYNAKIMPVRVLDTDGGSNLNVAAGIRYAANNGADVINLSLGGGYSSDIEAAVRYAVTQKGSVVVMAAGNEGSSEPGYPARYANQWGIAVGAVDTSKKMPDFSNRAGIIKMDYVVAPGFHVYSTAPSSKYKYLSGTSMSTPHVAGAVALVLSAKGSLTPTQVENVLRATANPTGITV